MNHGRAIKALAQCHPMHCTAPSLSAAQQVIKYKELANQF